MMFDAYHLPPRKARVCRVSGWLFALFALVAVATPALWLAGPAPYTYCVPFRCWMASEPLTLLDESDRAIIAAAPANGRKFADYVAQPDVRTGLAAIRLLKMLPFAAMVLSIGIALLRLGGASGDPLGRALPWVRRASLAAILWAVAKPVVDSLTATVLSAGLPGDAFAYYFATEWNEVGVALMLALAAYAMAWALEAGVTAQRDLAEIV